jgi:hypothetical protein
LWRDILLRVEAAPPGDRLELDLEGYDRAVILEHVALLREANLIDAKILKFFEGEGSFFIERLTWQGHDFLAAARSDTLWKRAKAIVREKGLDVSVAVMTELLKHLSKSALGLPTAIGES